MAMVRTFIRDVTPGMDVKIQGFVVNSRVRRTMAFLVIRDVTGKMQVTVDKAATPELSDAVDRLTIDSVVTIEGQAVQNEHVKLGGMELLPVSITIESIADALPITPDAEIDKRMDYRWVDLRSEQNALIFKLQTTIVQAMRDFLIERDFCEIHSPKLIGTASESGASVFKLDYFGREAFLAQSPQFYKQMAMAAGLDRVFEIGTIFRAEKSYTSKHTTEFTGFDLEMSFIDSYRDVMAMQEALLAHTLAEVSEKHGEAIHRLYGIDVIPPKTPFPVMTLREVYAELHARYGFAIPESEPGDLSTEAEQLTKQLVKDKFDHEFLFVTGFSAQERPFYHMRDENGQPLGYDLLWRGVEITTGAQREHRYPILKAQAEEKGLGEDVQTYLQFFRYGCPPHGGFGLGLDRLTMLFLGISIKEVMFVFRGPNRLDP